MSRRNLVGTKAISVIGAKLLLLLCLSLLLSLLLLPLLLRWYEGIRVPRLDAVPRGHGAGGNILHIIIMNDNDNDNIKHNNSIKHDNNVIISYCDYWQYITYSKNDNYGAGGAAPGAPGHAAGDATSHCNI